VPRERLDLGDFGERLARRHIEANGYTVVAERYRCLFGEVDLVARHGDALVFVEVKTRMSRSHGTALESVTPAKLRSFVKAAQHYLQRHPHDGDLRLDLIAIDLRGDGRLVGMEHIEGLEAPEV
jgi:putative endonuclease